MPAGRPPKYTSSEEMQKVIDAYFKKCDEEKRPYTITGLALALDMDRRSIVNYGDKDEFFLTVKKARLKVEAFLEEALHSGSPAGLIFNLKNNFGWKDKTEVEQSGTTIQRVIKVNPSKKGK